MGFATKRRDRFPAFRASGRRALAFTAVQIVNVAVLASGGGTNLQALIDNFQARGEDAPGRIALVVSNREGSGALGRAARHGIPAVVVRADGQDAVTLAAALREHDTGLVVLAGWLRRIPREILDAFPRRIINIHPALLPAFGGAGMYGERVHSAVLAAGARVTGVTIHLVEADYDGGAIVAQWPVPVHAHDTAEHLAARVLAAEHRLLPLVVADACRRLAFGGDIVPLAVAAEHFGAALHPQPALADPVINSSLRKR
jgi:phosphoribosylglycinamide formyltransferase-1